jgi:hypothetical protein
MAVLRAIAAFGVLALAATALLFVAAVAGVLVPIGALLAAAAPALVVTAFACIGLSRSTAAVDAPGLRWWMPLVWLTLALIDGVVWNLADRVTGGGHVERVAGQTVLVAHGRILRALDPAGVRAIGLWDARALGGHLLLMLAFSVLGLVALLASTPKAALRLDAPS